MCAELVFQMSGRRMSGRRESNAHYRLGNPTDLAPDRPDVGPDAPLVTFMTLRQGGNGPPMARGLILRRRLASGELPVHYL